MTKYLNSFDYASGSGYKTRQFNFSVDVTPGQIKLNPTEHDKYFFVNVNDEDFKTLNISENVKKVMVNTTSGFQLK